MRSKEEIIIFACIEKNIGDDLFIKILCERFPERIFLISDRAKYGSLARLCNLKFSKALRVWQQLENVKLTKWYKKLSVPILKRIIRCVIGKHNVCVYIVGNAFKNMDYKGAQQIKWLEDRIRLSNNFFILSTNFGPYNDSRWISDSKKVFHEVTDVCFRDKTSFGLFKDLSNVRYAPDAVLSFKTNKNTRIHQKCAIISIIDCSFRARPDWLKNKADLYEKKMADIIKRLVLDNWEVVLLNSNTEQDYPASERIKEQCLTSKIKVYNYNGDLESIFDLYSNADLVIGTRLHTIILAWLYRIPVLPIIYDSKVEAILSSYMFQGITIDIREIELLNYQMIKEIDDKWFIDPQIIDESNDQFSILERYLKYE